MYSVEKVRGFALGDTSVGAVVVGAGELDIVLVRGALLCKLGVSGCLTHLDTQGPRPRPLTRQVGFRPQAEEEFAKAQAWYESRSPGLGQQSVTCVQATVETVRRVPEQFPRAEGEVRRARVRG